MGTTLIEAAELVEARFRGVLEQMATHISTRFSSVKTFVTSFTNKPETWHVLNLECLLTRAQASASDNVTLSILMEGANNPKIQVDVCWGDPSGYVEAELFKAPQGISIETFEAIEEGLPSCFEALQNSVERGRPTEGPIG